MMLDLWLEPTHSLVSQSWILWASAATIFVTVVFVRGQVALFSPDSVDSGFRRLPVIELLTFIMDHG